MCNMYIQTPFLLKSSLVVTTSFHLKIFTKHHKNVQARSQPVNDTKN